MRYVFTARTIQSCLCHSNHSISTGGGAGPAGKDEPSLNTAHWGQSVPTNDADLGTPPPSRAGKRRLTLLPATTIEPASAAAMHARSQSNFRTRARAGHDTTGGLRHHRARALRHTHRRCLRAGLRCGCFGGSGVSPSLKCRPDFSMRPFCVETSTRFRACLSPPCSRSESWVPAPICGECGALSTRFRLSRGHWRRVTITVAGKTLILWSKINRVEIRLWLLDGST